MTKHELNMAVKREIKQRKFDQETRMMAKALKPFAEAGVPISKIAVVFGNHPVTIKGRLCRTGLYRTWARSNERNWHLFRGSKWEPKSGKTRRAA